jgi:hypothetical protein
LTVALHDPTLNAASLLLMPVLRVVALPRVPPPKDEPGCNPRPFRGVVEY